MDFKNILRLNPFLSQFEEIENVLSFYLIRSVSLSLALCINLSMIYLSIYKWSIYLYIYISIFLPIYLTANTSISQSSPNLHLISKTHKILTYASKK